MGRNLIRNGGFEAHWSEERSHRCLVCEAGVWRQREVDGILTPPGWTVWFRHEVDRWQQPEVRAVWNRREVGALPDSAKGLLVATPHGRHDAGLFQSVQISVGARLRLSARAVGRSSHPLKGYEDCAEDPRCSCGVGWGPAFLLEGDAPPCNGDPWNDATTNLTFALGIDPTGGRDPDAGTVCWSAAAHVYNAYHALPSVEVRAESEQVTVFVRSRARLPFQHNQACWDDVELVAVEDAVAKRPIVEPGRTYVLVPPDADERLMELLQRVTAEIGADWTVGTGDAQLDILGVRRVIALRPDAWPGAEEGAGLGDFFTRLYPEIEYSPVDWEDQDQLRSRLLAYGACCEPALPNGLLVSPLAADRARPTAKWTVSGAYGGGRLSGNSLRVVHVVLPPIADIFQRIEWRVAAAIGSAEGQASVAHALDGNGGRREIVAVNPGRWGVDPEEWLTDDDPHVRCRVVESDSPWEAAIELLPAFDGDIALAQADPRWADYDFGEDPRGTIGRYGCFLTGLAMILRKVYRRDVTPPVLDRLLVAAREPYSGGNLLMWPDTVPLFPALTDGVRDDRQRSARELRELLDRGWEVILRRADGGHFVYLEDVQGDVLRIIDTWDGARKQHRAADYRGIRAARVVRRRAVDGTNGVTRQEVLLPPIEDPVERLKWRITAAIGSAGTMATVGHAIDGGVTARRRIVAVNPERWEDELEEWVRCHLPSAERTALETDSPWEMAIELLPRLHEDIALSQTDPRWAALDFGEGPGGAEGTIGRYGCFLTGLAIALRRVYQRDVTPPMLDRLLVTARVAYLNDNLLMWNDAAPLFLAFDDFVKDNRRRSARELERLLHSGWEVILRRADGAHFVYLEDVQGDTLHVIDTWDGARGERTAAQFMGIRAAHVRLRAPLPPPTSVSIGLHDRGGGEWMAAQGVRGCCLVHTGVQHRPVEIDCRALQDAGQTVICRLNWGYAGGAGTLPGPDERDGFVDAVVETLLRARGVDYFHVGNEPNNRQEWPGFDTDHEFPLTAGYVVDIYNAIWRRVAGRVRLGPPPLDPYFGPNSDNREWWIEMMERIAGADALFLHAKTQTNDPAEVRSRARFRHDPLTWQYLHLRTVETALAVVPDRFRALPVFVTELNPQHLETIGGAMGWKANNAAWVHEAMAYFRHEQPVTGVIFYRYDPAGDQAPFGLADKPAVLDAIRAEAE